MATSGYGPSAWEFPIWFVLEESDLVNERLDSSLAAAAVLNQMAMTSIPNQAVKPASTKGAAKSFSKKIKELMRVR